MIIIDEAYVEFVSDPDAVRGLELLRSRPNVVVLRTFSKAYGLAGFRVGYCVAEPGLAAAVRAVSLPFGVSVPAQAAVVASLQVEPALFGRVGELVAARDRLAGGASRTAASRCRGPGQLRLAARPERTLAYADAFAEAGLMVRPYAAGDATTGSGSPSVSRRRTHGYSGSRRPSSGSDTRQPAAAGSPARICQPSRLACRAWRRAHGHAPPTPAPSAAGRRSVGSAVAGNARPGAAWSRTAHPSCPGALLGADQRAVPIRPGRRRRGRRAP